MQTRLRTELQTVVLENANSAEPIEGAPLNTLNTLPYLDAVVRETLRLYTPVPAISRTAIRDDVVSLEKPFIDRNGMTRDTIKWVILAILLLGLIMFTSKQGSPRAPQF